MTARFAVHHAPTARATSASEGWAPPAPSPACATRQRQSPRTTTCEGELVEPGDAGQSGTAGTGGVAGVEGAAGVAAGHSGTAGVLTGTAASAGPARTVPTATVPFSPMPTPSARAAARRPAAGT